MKLPRREFLYLGVIAAALPSMARNTRAQAYPMRPVTLIVPFPAGGALDIVARALATATEKHLGQPFVIENRAGANGVLAPTQMAATAAPDHPAFVLRGSNSGAD